MTDWITQREAAGILGVHKSRVAKLVAEGQLHPRRAPAHRASLDRREVVALATWRADAPGRARLERERRAAERDAARTYHRVPDDGHDWLSIRQVAELLGLSKAAVLKRCRRGQLAYVEHGRQLWVRRDLLELAERARAAQRDPAVLTRDADDAPSARLPRA